MAARPLGCAAASGLSGGVVDLRFNRLTGEECSRFVSSAWVPSLATSLPAPLQAGRGLRGACQHLRGACQHPALAAGTLPAGAVRRRHQWGCVVVVAQWGTRICGQASGGVPAMFKPRQFECIGGHAGEACYWAMACAYLRATLRATCCLPTTLTCCSCLPLRLARTDASPQCNAPRSRQDRTSSRCSQANACLPLT